MEESGNDHLKQETNIQKPSSFHKQEKADIERIFPLMFPNNKDENISTFEKKEKINETITSQLITIFNNLESSNLNEFSLTVKQSSISNSGNGVFIEGKREPGSIIAIYKGTVYFPEFKMIVYPSVYEGNDYLINRFDGIMLDGKEDGVSGNIFSMNLDKEKVLSKKKQLQAMASSPNPFAVAQFINHSHDDDNVLCFGYNFPSSFPTHLRKYIPNIYFSSKPNANILMHTIVMISTRKLENEEILFNYRFNINNSNIPTWAIKQIQTEQNK